MVRKIKAFSLMELIIVIAIFAILLVIAVPLFSKWRTRYYIESDIKSIYSLLERGRFEAFSNKKDLTLKIQNNQACLQDDNNNNIECIKLKNPFTGKVEISKRGTFNKTSILYSGNANVNPVYDCIVVTYTRAKLGAYDGTKCKAK